MSKEVNAAIGTQRQFAKQPERPYALDLIRTEFSGGRQSTDYDYQVLSNALGILPNVMEKERIAQDKREREQATLVNADKILSGKTKDDLKTFDTLTELQNVTGEFDLTDNKYAVAVLDKGKGRLAASYAKQQWADLPESQKPKSVEDSVNRFNGLMAENYKELGQGVINRTAFDDGYYEGMLADTQKVAIEANARINDEKRKQLLNIGQVEIQDMIYHGLNGNNFKAAFGESFRKIELASRSSDEIIKTAQATLDILASVDYTADRINTVLDTPFMGNRTIRNEISVYPYLKKISQNFNLRVADDVYEKAKRPDGTVDFSKVNVLLDEMPTEFTGVSIPSINIPVSSGVILSDKTRSYAPLVGGVLANMGADTVMQIQSAGEDSLSVYVGDTHGLTAVFAPYFDSVQHNGSVLELKGYNGGLDKRRADVNDVSASAYDPKRKANIMKQLELKDNAARTQLRKNKQRDMDTVMSELSNAKNELEAHNIIYKSQYMTEQQKTALEKKWKNREAFLSSSNIDLHSKYMLSYEKNTLMKDYQTIQDWENWKNDPDNSGTAAEDYPDFEKKVKPAAFRLNNYSIWQGGGNIVKLNGESKDGSVSYDDFVKKTKDFVAKSKDDKNPKDTLKRLAQQADIKDVDKFIADVLGEQDD